MIKKSRKGNKHLEKKFFSKRRHTRKSRKIGGSLPPLQKSYPGAFPALEPKPTGFNFLNPMIGRGRIHNKYCNCVKCTVHPKNCKCIQCHKCNTSIKKCNCHAAKYHPKNCKCTKCMNQQKGGQSLPYPNGLLGSPWTPNVSTWKQNNIAMDNNHLAFHNYIPDVSREMIDVGANPPFTYLKGGKPNNYLSKQNIFSRNADNYNSIHDSKLPSFPSQQSVRKGFKKTKTLKKSKKGGSNFLTQDLINLGRQVSFGANSVYNGLRGYAQPVNPLPWKDQFQHQS